MNQFVRCKPRSGTCPTVVYSQPRYIWWFDAKQSLLFTPASLSRPPWSIKALSSKPNINWLSDFSHWKHSTFQMYSTTGLHRNIIICFCNAWASFELNQIQHERCSRARTERLKTRQRCGSSSDENAPSS